MIDLKKPETLFDSLLNKFDGMDVLPNVRFYGVYTGNFLEPASNFGAFGFLPFAGTSTGDVIALAPILKKPIEEWPAAKFSHSGGTPEIIASSLQLFTTSAIADELRPEYIEDDKESILETKKEILSLARLLRDDKQAKAMISFLEKYKEDDEKPMTKLDLYQLSEGNSWLTEFMFCYKKVYTDDENAVNTWQNYLKKHPFVIPAWELLFGALSKSGKDAFEPAWKCATAEPFFNNCISDLCRNVSMGIGYEITDSKNFDLLFDDTPRLEACQYIAESSKGKALPEFQAIKKEAEEESCAEEWLSAGNTLLKAKKPEDAYRAFINAGFAFYNEEDDFNLVCAERALKAAEALNDSSLIFIHKSLLEQMEGE